MKRKFLAILLALMLVLASLVAIGCDDKKENSTGDNTTQQGQGGSGGTGSGGTGSADGSGDSSGAIDSGSAGNSSGSGSSGSVVYAQKTIIEVVYQRTSVDAEWLEAVVDRFEQLNEEVAFEDGKLGITVKISIERQIQPATIASSSTDVYIVCQQNFQQFIEMGVVYDLTDLWEKTSKYDQIALENKAVAGSYEDYMQGGKIYAFPFFEVSDEYGSAAYKIFASRNAGRNGNTINAVYEFLDYLTSKDVVEDICKTLGIEMPYTYPDN